MSIDMGGAAWPSTATAAAAASTGPVADLARARSDFALVAPGSVQRIAVDCYAADGTLLLDGLQLGIRDSSGSTRWQPATVVDGRAYLVTPGDLARGRYGVQAQRGGVIVSGGAFAVNA